MTPSRLVCSATMSLRILFSKCVLVKVLVQGMPTITATDQLHALTDGRTRLCEIDNWDARMTPNDQAHRRAERQSGAARGWARRHSGRAHAPISERPMMLLPFAATS